MARKLFTFTLPVLVAVALAAGPRVVHAQDVVEPPSVGIVVEVAPRIVGSDVLAPTIVDGEVLAPVPQVRSLTFSADGSALFFAHPVTDDPASLLDMGNVQQELELIDEQKESIRQAQQKSRDAINKHFTEMRELHTKRIRDLQDEQASGAGGGGGGRNSAGGTGRNIAPRALETPEEMKRSQERIKELRDELAKQIDDVLLPHQRKRLKEISLRMKMKQRGTTGSLVDTELAKTLDIGEAQKERIRRRAAEVQKELEEKIAKLREEAREQILEELTPDQQRKLKDMLGSEFDDKPQPPPPPRIRKLRTPADEPKSERAADPKPAERGS
jgi:hypothetical protein